MTIEAASIAVQIGGKAYFVSLPHDRMMILMKMAEGLSDSGKLNVVAAPASYKLMPIGELA